MIIHFDAGHDKNGNPRRAYVRFSETHGHGAIAQVWTEGYRGSRAVDEAYWDESARAPRVPTTPAFYRTLKRLADTLRDATPSALEGYEYVGGEICKVAE